LSNSDATDAATKMPPKPIGVAQVLDASVAESDVDEAISEYVERSPLQNFAEILDADPVD